MAEKKRKISGVWCIFNVLRTLTALKYLRVASVHLVPRFSIQSLAAMTWRVGSTRITPIIVGVDVGASMPLILIRNQFVNVASSYDPTGLTKILTPEES